MFEAVFKITTLVESDGQGQLVFKVTEQGTPISDKEFSSLMANVYQQDVYRTLRTGDDLTITVHLDLPIREITRTVRFREDKQFEGDGMQRPTSDLLPMISTMYEQFRQQVVPGDVLRITFHVHRS